MHTIVLYRQARVDGGVRTGISVNDETVLHEFKPGKNDDNPALLWFVDVRFRGKGLPTSPDEVREFLIEAATHVKEALLAAADDLGVGLDSDVLPYVRETELERGITLKIVCSANRRTSGLQMAKHVRQIASRWVELAKELRASHVG
jgi:hypothetical protein